MAFDGKTGALQTSVNAAATMVSAGLQSGALGLNADPDSADAIDELYMIHDTLTNKVFEKLSAQVDADAKGGGSGGTGRPRPSGGYRKSGGSGKGGGFTGSGDEAGNIALTWGAFKGLTLAEVYELSEDDASEYGYTGSGKKYVNWMSKNKQNDYMATRAKAFLAAKRAEDDE